MDDMQTLLDVSQKFVDWSRFKLKSSKSRALVFKKGCAVEWKEGEVEGEEGQVKLRLGGDVIPNVSEKPIKFLGRWIRAEGNDKEITDTTRTLMKTYLDRLDQSYLSGLQKCWGYQYMVLPKLKWPLAIYDIPITTIAKWEQTTNSFLRMWLGVGHTLSNLCLFSQSSSVALPITSLTDTWKTEKCRLLQSYQTSSDELIRSVRPQVRSGRAWKPAKELEEAERDLICESMRGMVQPYSKAGIGYGDWKKPWEKMDDREKQREVISRVRDNIQGEREVKVGSLEMQSRWGTWRDTVVKTDMSWNTMFKFGDSLIGFMLSAVYGTLMTPALVAKWSDDEDGNCKLCSDKLGTIQHILSGCKTALGQGRYRWRHDKVLLEISEQVTYHVEKRVNTSKNRISPECQSVKFVKAGKGPSEAAKKVNTGHFGVLGGARDWVVLSDLEEQLKFPKEIIETRLRPDLVLFSRSTRKVVWWELTVPSEERIAVSHEYKLDRYSTLQAEIQAKGWSCVNVAVEVGARGVVGRSLESAARSIGIRGRILKKFMREVSGVAVHCSRWLYLLSRKKEWEVRKVG